MNFIQIVSDTLRRDFLGCYGNEWIHTEHLDAFAKKSLVFDKAYIASFPTMPNRADIFTGKWTFYYLGWAPLPQKEVLLAEVLQKAGYFTKAVVDIPMFVRGGYNYDRGFLDFELIRGQELGAGAAAAAKAAARRDYALQRRYETDYCAPATMLAASRWLERHSKEKFFLYVDTWDPHEPWDPPRWYADMYYPKGGEEVVKVGGQNDIRAPSFHTLTEYEKIRKRLALGSSPNLTTNLTEDELKRLRALYAGEITMVDRWVGMLLQKIEDLGLFENTAIIFTSDHGTYNGEHGYVHKRPHLYEEVAHIPLIIRLPDSQGGRCDALVQPPDLMPTILELAGVQIPETVQGKSLLPVIRGEESEIREFAVSSQNLLQTHWITVTSKEWSLIAVRGAPLQIDKLAEKVEPYSIKVDPYPANIFGLTHKYPTELYHLPTDPKQTRNLFDEKKEVAEELHSKMIQFLESLGTREDLLRRWKGKNKLKR